MSLTQKRVFKGLRQAARTEELVRMYVEDGLGASSMTIIGQMDLCTQRGRGSNT